MPSPNENSGVQPPRSSLLHGSTTSALLVIDVQEKLLPKIHQRDSILTNMERLIRVAKLLQVPILVSEQYPEKLGPTVSSLRDLIPPADTKRMFSCRELWDVWSQKIPEHCRTLVVCGIEAHVCVLQTVLDFQSLGWNVAVPVDAVSSRFENDYQVAIKRMEASGVSLVSTEMLLFEWCETSLRPEFKEVSEIVKGRGDA